MTFSGCATTTATSNARTAPDPDDPLASLFTDQPEVVFATEFPVASAGEAVARADRASASGDLDLALYLYVRAYDLEKDNIHALAKIGEIHESRGNDKLAMLAFTSVLRIDPAHSAALQSLGLAYLRARRFEEAHGLLEQAVLANSALWRAHNGLGFIADLRGDHATAIAAYNAAIALNPDDASLINNRGYSWYLAGEYDAASVDFRDARARGVERASLNLGLVLARQQRYAEAVRMMSYAIKPEVAYNDVGYIAMRQGDMQLAETYFRKAIGLAPRYFEAAQRNIAELKGEREPETGVRYLGADAAGFELDEG